MNEEIAKKIDEFENRRAHLLQALCEDERIYIPEVLLNMVSEIRSITKIMKMLKGGGDNF